MGSFLTLLNKDSPLLLITISNCNLASIVTFIQHKDKQNTNTLTILSSMPHYFVTLSKLSSCLRDCYCKLCTGFSAVFYSYIQLPLLELQHCVYKYLYVEFSFFFRNKFYAFIPQIDSSPPPGPALNKLFLSNRFVGYGIIAYHFTLNMTQILLWNL